MDVTKSVQIGLRGDTRTLNWLQTSYDLGYEVITMDRYREIGARAAGSLYDAGQR